MSQQEKQVQLQTNLLEMEDNKNATEAETAPLTSTRELKTNRKKAILLQQIGLIFNFMYTVGLKYTMNTMKVGVLDIVLIRTLTLCVVSGLLARYNGYSFTIEKSQRGILAFRSFVGTVGYTLFTFGISLVPLVVLQIIFNMAPFWTYFMGWAFLGETMTCFEVFALVVSFSGVILIATAKKDHEAEKVGVTGLSGQTAQIVGSVMLFIVSWCYATVSIQTRLMQNISVFIINFYYSAFAALVAAVMIAGSPLVSENPIQTFSYTPNQYVCTVLCCLLNVVSMTCQTTAMQNEKSGLITLMGYSSLVYAFFGDTFIFKDLLIPQEVVGIAIILTLNVTLIVSKLNSTATTKPQ